MDNHKKTHLRIRKRVRWDLGSFSISSLPCPVLSIRCPDLPTAKCPHFRVSPWLGLHVHSCSLEDVYFPSAGWGEKCKSPLGSNLLDKMAAAVQRRAPACLLPLACNPLQLICISLSVYNVNIQISKTQQGNLPASPLQPTSTDLTLTRVKFTAESPSNEIGHSLVSKPLSLTQFPGHLIYSSFTVHTYMDQKIIFSGGFLE